MAEEGLKAFTSEAELKPPPPPSEAELKPPPPATEAVAESTDVPLLLEVEAGAEPPLAALDLQAVELACIEPPVTAEEKVKEPEAVEVVQRETPLEYLPPEVPVVTEHVTVAAVDTDAATHHVSQPLAVALGLSQEEVVSPDTQMKEMIGPEKKLTDKQKAPIALGSFKEESNKASDLSHSELNALEELKLIVQEALDKGALSGASSSEAPEEVWIWGVPLMSDERSDAILLKFLRAREFKVKESYAMLKNTIKWRRDFNVDELVKEDLGDDLEKAVFMHGNDKEGHPVCYNIYGEFQNKELYANTFGDEEKRIRFLRWRIQFLERSIRKLDFSPGGVNTIFQVSDLKNSPGPAKRELRIATNQALHILQDNYPELVAKQVFINVPWWHLAFYTMISPFLTQRTKSKFVFAGPARTTETLFKYISPEQVPILYGGLSTGFCECNPEFTFDDPAAEITIKPATKQTVEIIVNEKCILVWELRVVGWEVSYSAEFVPNSERSYTVIIQKTKKMALADVPVLSDRFAVSELGKILLIINNPVAIKKKLVYRFKVLPYVPSVKNA